MDRRWRRRAGTMRDRLAVGVEEGTPAAAGAAHGDAQFLFVQSFASGHLSPMETGDGVYLLELTDHLGQTLYFSDRPQRVVGTLSTAQFLEGLGFTPANPPNAAVVAASAGGDDEILVVELLDPRYDESGGVLTYDVRILADDERGGMTFRQDVHGDDRTGATFGACHLFIDDCPTYHGACHRPNQAAQDLGCAASAGTRPWAHAHRAAACPTRAAPTSQAGNAT